MFLLILSLFAQAEEPTVVYKEKTEIDFEALDIEGSLKKPVGVLLSERKEIIFNPLVKIREEWISEMNESINDIQ